MSSANKKQRSLIVMREAPLVVLLLTVYAFLSYSAAWTKCNTFDEKAHLTNGFVYWDTNDYRTIPEAVLPLRWFSLPVYLGGFSEPEYASEGWKNGNDWLLSEQFFYEVGNDPDVMLRCGRAMAVLVGVLLGLLVYCWSRSLFGRVGGLVSLSLYAFSPTVLAHGGLITTDLPAAMLYTASTWFLWVLLHRVSLRNVLLSTVAVGSLFITKMTAVLMIPIGLLLLLIKLVGSQPMQVELPWFARRIAGRVHQFSLGVVLVGVHVLVAWVIVWATFGFRFSSVPDGQVVPYGSSWDYWNTRIIESDAGWKGSVVTLLHNGRLLPEAYVGAAANVLLFTSQRHAFLNGESSDTGWRIFFPFCLLVKTPLPVFAMLALSFGAAAGRQVEVTSQRRSGLYAIAPLLVWLGVYWAAAISSSFNIGHRHILPTYPAMFILAGAASGWLIPRAGALHKKDQPSHVMPFAVVALLGALAVETLLAWPDYLPYFNRIVGGSRNGYKHLIDSSIDWGQDLPGLKKWLDREGLQEESAGVPVYLSYFGTARPEHYGIQAIALQHSLPGFHLIKADVGQPWTAGVYCISATAIQSNGVTSNYGRWNREDELIYKSLAQQARKYHQAVTDDESEAQLFREQGERVWREEAETKRQTGLISGTKPSTQEMESIGQEYWFKLFRDFDRARFGRLVAYLRQREPDDQIHYSILIYQLSDEDLNEAFEGPPPEQARLPAK